jgi:hypothetical protein
MRQTSDVLPQNFVERLCWAACWDHSRMARRLYRKLVVGGVYCLDEGTLLDEFFHYLQELRLLELMTQVMDTAVNRAMVLFLLYLLLYGLKTLFGVESIKVLPPCCSALGR